MRRSQSSSTGMATPRRTLFPRNGGNACWNYPHGSNDRHANNISTNNANRHSQEAAAATEAGRSILGRPKLPDLDPTSPFTACAARSPIRRVVTDVALKSCLSSSSFQGGSSGTTRSSSSNNGSNSNEEFDLPAARSTSSSSSSTPLAPSSNSNSKPSLVRNVSFSTLRVREYEVTLGDNPAVSSGAPLSLGWRYDPQESVSSLNNNNDGDDNDGSSNNADESSSIAGAASNPSSSQLSSSSTTMSPSSSSSSSSLVSQKQHHQPQQQTVRRTKSELRLSDRERHRRISANPNVSMEDLQLALQSVAVTRWERKESLNELRQQQQKRRQSSPAKKCTAYTAFAWHGDDDDNNEMWKKNGTGGDWKKGWNTTTNGGGGSSKNATTNNSGWSLLFGGQ